MGQALAHGEGYPDWLLRLFHRGRAEWSHDAVHERVKLNGRIGKIKGDLNHHSQESLDAYFHKQNMYSSLQAKSMWESGRRSSLLKIAASPTVRFLKFYVMRLGFLDGVPGLVHIAIGCFSSFAKYAKLREFEINGVQASRKTIRFRQLWEKPDPQTRNGNRSKTPKDHRGNQVGCNSLATWHRKRSRSAQQQADCKHRPDFAQPRHRKSQK